MVLSKLDPDRQLMDSGTLPGPFEYVKRRGKRGGAEEVGVNRTIPAIAKPRRRGLTLNDQIHFG